MRVIRKICKDDLPEIIKLSEKIHSAGDFRGNFSHGTCHTYLSDFIDRHDHMFFCFEQYEKILGIGFFYVSDFFWDHGSKVCNEIALNANPDLTNYKKTKILIELIDFMVKYLKERDLKYYIDIFIPFDSPLEEHLLKKDFYRNEKLMTKVT